MQREEKVTWAETSEPDGPAPRQRSKLSKYKSIRQQVSLSEEKFDTRTLPADIQRVYCHLAEKFGEEYALTFVFTVRTASELHRAWHMTLLTSRILQQIKDKFNMRMTWELGVFKLKFRVEDGGYELHRKVPYDYDSEFQDLYMKIAVALVEGRITIHQALNFQSDTKHGKHTAASGLFLRDFPGRLVLYPIEAATCAVIFFSGDWYDAGIAALCGFVAGLVEYALSTIGGDAKTLIDVLVGTSTGIISGLFYRFHEEHDICLPAIFLGTLYWFFYGTAFVLGILEIIAGELETGVVRFMAVSVKTFVLTLGTTFGMRIALENSYDAWFDQAGCGNIDLDTKWWRIPLYLACSASALGQYRLPIVHYWRGLIVQLVGYEVQYQAATYFVNTHQQDNLGVASSNVLGAMAAVLAAVYLSGIVNKLSSYYNARLLQRNPEPFSSFGESMYNLTAWWVRVSNAIGFGRKSDLTFLEMEDTLRQQSRELNDPNHARQQITLNKEQEGILLEAIVGAEPLNIWSLLMPTVYQLVPGSLIAKLWFNSVFPPDFVDEGEATLPSGETIKTEVPDKQAEAVFSNLMVIATSLALGLMLGLGLVQLLNFIATKTLKKCFSVDNRSQSTENLIKRKDARQSIMGTIPEDDPDSDDELQDVNDEADEVEAKTPSLTEVNLDLLEDSEASDEKKDQIAMEVQLP